MEEKKRASVFAYDNLGEDSSKLRKLQGWVPLVSILNAGFWPWSWDLLCKAVVIYSIPLQLRAAYRFLIAFLPFECIGCLNEKNFRSHTTKNLVQKHGAADTCAYSVVACLRISKQIWLITSYMTSSRCFVVPYLFSARRMVYSVFMDEGFLWVEMSYVKMFQVCIVYLLCYAT